jgi:hypothetical protein
MKKQISLLPALALAAGLTLAGCDSPSVEPTGSADADVPEEGLLQPASRYETEVLSIKSREPDPELRDAAIREAMIRHGIRPAAPRVEAPLPEAPAPRIPAAKAATTRVLRAKEFAFAFDWVITRRVNVASGSTLHAYTTRAQEDQNVDPRIVAFYPELPDNLRTTTRIVGLNDDYTGLDSRISWKNTTGVTRQVTVHVFAYSSASTGKATLKYYLKSAAGVQGPLVSLAGRAVATAVSANLPPRYACEYPDDSVIDTFTELGGGYDAGVIAVNPTLMRGGYVHESKPSLALGFVIPPGGGNFLLGFFEGNPADSYANSRYRAVQDDFYSFCP